MKKLSFSVILSIFIILAFRLPSFSQEGRGQGRVFGTVKDENGNPIERAKIVCESLQYNLTLNSSSNKKGNWAIVGVGSGMFRLSATKDGYLPSETQTRISHFRNPAIDFVLKSVESADVHQAVQVGEASRQLFREATSFYEDGKYSTALELFQKFLEENPTIFQVGINIGNCYREMGDYEKAIEEYKIVLADFKAKNPNLQGNEEVAIVLTNIGETYILMDDVEKGTPFLEEALKIFPNDNALAYNVAEIFFKRGQIDKAIEYYSLSSQIKPDWPRAYLRKGYALLNKADYNGAITSFAKFLEVAPDDPEAANIEKVISELKKMKKD